MAEELSIENEADFVKKRLLSAILALAMTAACLTACSESNDSSQMQSAADSSARASHSDGEFSLPKGADSEYELYQTVINYLNNGFHIDDLSSVRSVELTTVFWQKNQEKEKRNFTLGLKYDEACQLIAKLRKVAKEIDWPRRPDGSPDDELKDYSPFEKEFPESLQQQIKDNHEEFERFISELAFSAFFKIDGDGESPFRGLEKTKWDTVSQSEFKSQENDLKENEKYKDMTDNFPMCYMVDLGEYKQGRDVYYTGYYYTKIDGKYYFVAFDTAVGSAGG